MPIPFDKPQILCHRRQDSRQDPFARADLKNAAGENRRLPGHGGDAERQSRVRKEVLSEAFVRPDPFFDRLEGFGTAPFFFQGKDDGSFFYRSFLFLVQTGLEYHKPVFR
ncbi:hypothetical protein BOX30_07945 [Leptospirillum ferriphilum]|nr:hypothetical protein BOX30_07945 [Leptospirillum ferriphilum]